MRKMIVCCLAAALFALAYPPVAMAADEKKKDAKEESRPNVDVVFCLDTTGSMSGLINAAKQKIWKISNQIAVGKPTPNLRVGLIAYRDRGDEYVTKIFELTDDLDDVYANLMKFQANGGGDTPESVNQALHEAVTKIKWTTQKKALKIIFLVGDAPPKIYADDVPYTKTCQLAAKSSIIINTIQCGNRGDTQQEWQKICKLAEGRYVRIDQSGGPIQIVSTPFDKKLAKINTELNETTVVFGSAESQRMAKSKLDANSFPGTKLGAPAGDIAPGFGGGGLSGSATAAPLAKAAERAGFYANSRRFTSYDLIEQVNNKKVKLEDLKQEHFPNEMQTMTLKEKRAHLEKLAKQREKLLADARDLDKKRQSFIQKKQTEEAKKRGTDSFDNQVLEILQSQAGRSDIQYGVTEPAKKKSKK